MLAARLSALGSNPPARVKLFVLTLVLGARWILGRPSLRLRRVRIQIGGFQRVLRLSDYGELQVLRDIVLDGEYSFSGPEPDTILDLGANIGLASLWFRARYPRARIIAVEPDPETFAKLQRNLADDEHVTLVNAAAGRENTTMTLYRPAGYSIASSLRGREHEPETGVAVSVRTLDDLWDELGVERVDLLKLDVEGAELDVLDGFSRLDSVGMIVGEAHPQLLDGGVERFFERLRSFHVERVSDSPEAVSFIATRD